MNFPDATTAYRDTGAWDLLDAWMSAKPGRFVKRMVKGRGETSLYSLTLSGRKEYTSATQHTLESAVRTALMIAYQEGDR